MLENALSISTVIPVMAGERTKAHWDKSPLGQNPLDNIPLIKTPLLNLVGWTKAHLKNRLKSFIKLLTLSRLLLRGKSHLQCVFTDKIIYVYGVTNNLIGVLKAIYILRKLFYSFGQTIYYNWETYV